MNAPSPIVLAKLHAAEIRKAVDKANIEARCISQLFVGRRVRNIHSGKPYWVSQVTVAPSGSVTFHGRIREASKVQHTIGTLEQIEVIT